MFLFRSWKECYEVTCLIKGHCNGCIRRTGFDSPRNDFINCVAMFFQFPHWNVWILSLLLHGGETNQPVLGIWFCQKTCVFIASGMWIIQGHNTKLPYLSALTILLMVSDFWIRSEFSLSHVIAQKENWCCREYRFSVVKGKIILLRNLMKVREILIMFLLSCPNHNNVVNIGIHTL